MVKVTEFVNAKYLAAKTAGEYNGKTLTIDSVFPEIINEDEKLCVRFNGVERPLALNQGNLTALMAAYGDDSDMWISHKVILHLVRVTFNGQQVPSIQIEPITK